MVRGEIYFADPGPRSGSEVRGARPCILVSDDAYNTQPKWNSVTVVPCTTAERWLKPSPTNVQFEAGECGLPRRCAAIVVQITTLDKAKIHGPPIGRLTSGKEADLAEAIRNYLSLD